MKINFRQGFFRICIVITGLVLLFAFTFGGLLRFDDAGEWVGWAGCLAFIWGVYWIGVYIANGFARRL